jgi:ribosomal protein S17
MRVHGTMAHTPNAELKLGDRVRIPGESLEGTVTDVHPHAITVKVVIDGETVHKKYAHESLVREPTMDEASKFVDH